MAEASSHSAQVASVGHVTWLSLVLALLWLPACVGRQAVSDAASLWPLAQSANPYFVPEHIGLLYGWSPLVVLSACTLLLSPGLFLALACNRGKDIGQWVVCGFGLSILVLSVVTQAAQAMLGSPLRGDLFVLLVVCCALLCACILLVRVRQAASISWPLNTPYAMTGIASMLGVPLILLILLAPKLYWENFNGDGAQAYESARLLLNQPVPFWPPAAGDTSSFPGITSMLFTYPTSWFLRLFGESEAAARLPLILQLIALYGAMLALVEGMRAELPGRAERWLIGLAVLVYAFAMAFSATYNPYAADIALPATQDTLAMVCYLGYILYFIRGQNRWMMFFALLTYLSLPNGLLLVGLWAVSVIAVWRPRPWAQLRSTFWVTLVFVVVAAALPSLLAVMHLPAPGSEYGLVNTLKRFALLQVTDWRRIFFLIVPGGILPGMALLAWRWHDKVGKVLTLVAVAYFFLFYVQAHVVLHYFVPVMLLPVVVLWRSKLAWHPKWRGVVIASAALAGVFALWLSLPQNWSVDTSARTVGSAIEERVGGYAASNPAVFRASELMGNLFPYDWDPTVPGENYGGSPLAWNYYAHAAVMVTRATNYVLQPPDEPAPEGMRLVAKNEAAALYLRDNSVLASHLALRPATPAGSLIYQLPRGTIFRSVALVQGPPEINVVDIIESFGYDMGPLLARLGVQR